MKEQYSLAGFLPAIKHVYGRVFDRYPERLTIKEVNGVEAIVVDGWVTLWPQDDTFVKWITMANLPKTGNRFALLPCLKGHDQQEKNWPDFDRALFHVIELVAHKEAHEGLFSWHAFLRSWKEHAVSK